jgi:exodeoxyribonuclease VII small subunit
MARQKKKEERFEDQLEKLESIVNRLEDESVGLEQALELFEEGMGLARTCRQRLEEIEKRIERLLEDNDEAEPRTVSLELE